MNFEKFLRTLFDGPERALFSSMVFQKGQTVLGSLKQFSEVLNSFRKSQTVFGSLKQFSEVLNSSQKSQAVPGTLKLFLEL